MFGEQSAYLYDGIGGIKGRDKFLEAFVGSKF